RAKVFSSRTYETHPFCSIRNSVQCGGFMFLAILGLTASSISSPAVSTPIGLLPANPHYFEFRGKPTILITSGEHYGAVLNLDFDYIRYLDALKANNVNNIGKIARTDAYNLKHADLQAVQDAVVRKIVGELREFDNLYYEICNEPYFGGVTLEWQRHISSVVTEVKAGMSRRHLISQ